MIRLTDLENKKTVKVIEINGGTSLVDRLDAMGIRLGEEITKIRSHFWHGPVTVKVGRAKVAIGHSMAQKIMVEEDK